MLSIIHKKSVFIPLIIMGLVIAFVLDYQFSKPSVKPAVSANQDSELAKEAKDLVRNQEPIRNFYNSAPLDAQTKMMVFYEFMEPLGGLDPIAKPAEIKDIHAIVNFLYGGNFSLFNFPLDEAGYSATAPIRHENDFNEIDFFNKNASNVEQLVRAFENDNNLTVLNWGYSTNYRINEYFGDDVRNFYWKISPNNSPFYSSQIIQSDSKNYQKIVSLKEDYDDLLNIMSDMKIQSVYKCDDKVIFIVDGLSDNAFGYIYNAQSGSDVNCGVLKGRFRVIKDEVINDKWRFWFAK